MPLFIILLILLFVIFLFNNFVWKRRNLPPGPTPLPLIGNKLAVNREPPGYNVLLRWAKEYGPIYTYWLGESPIVVISEFSVLEDTFVRDGDTYAGRAFLADFFKAIKSVGSTHGVVNTEGEQWVRTRRLALQILRNLGLGKNLVEKKILAEVKLFVESVERDLSNGNGIQNLIDKMDIAVGSVINQLTFGFTFNGERRAEHAELKHLVESHIIGGSELLTRTIMIMPVLRHLPIFLGAFRRAEKHVLQLYGFLDRQIDESIIKLNSKACEDEEPTYLVEAYLRHIETARGTDDEQYINRKNLRGICEDLFVAGQDTTSNTMAFLVSYLMQWPDVQRRMQQELDLLSERKRLDRAVDDNDILDKEDFYIVSNSDRADLPYTNAVINESQRLCNLMPENVLHKTTRDVIILGHMIPKGTRVVPQISCVLYDEKIFPNARSFKPERFLDENGKLKTYKELIPFSVGKRRCMGESLAKMELFLFVANLFLRFKISAVDSTQFTIIPGVIVRPTPYLCRIEKRKYSGTH